MSSDSAATGRITLPAALRRSVAAAGAAALSVTQHGSTVSLRPASVHGPSVPERLRRPRRSGSAPAAGSLSPRPSAGNLAWWRATRGPPAERDGT